MKDKKKLRKMLRSLSSDRTVLVKETGRLRDLLEIREQQRDVARDRLATEVAERARVDRQLARLTRTVDDLSRKLAEERSVRRRVTDALTDALNQRPIVSDEVQKTVIAPFVPAQLMALKAHQEDKIKHPYTCPNAHGPLGVFPGGLSCGQCGYKQEWAWLADACGPAAPELTREDVQEGHPPASEVVVPHPQAGWADPPETSHTDTTTY